MNASRRAKIRSLVSLAADAIGPAWPLDTFVAVNPLLGKETDTFEDATAHAAALFHARVLPDAPHDRAAGVIETLGDSCARIGWGDVVGRVDERTSRWLSAYFDRGEAAWPMPHRERGFYHAWKRLARHENALSNSARAYRRELDALPARAEDALLANLDALEIPEEARAAYLERHLAQCAGWSSYIKQVTTADADVNIDLIALLAVRTWYERHECRRAARAHGAIGTFDGVHAWAREFAPVGGRASDAGFDRGAHTRALVALEERERAFRDDLLSRIRREPAPQPAPIEAQFAFCIDARSEPLRRHIEASGNYETFGFAGFFGVPLRHRPFGAPQAVAQAPVLVRPTLLVEERPTEASAREIERATVRASAGGALAAGALAHPIGAFAGVEAFGLVAAARALLRTFFAGLLTRAEEEASEQPLALDAIAFADRVFFAEATLRIMGLTHDFAPFVVLCGHGGGTVNNAFASSLDCGACGGNRGLVNARVACAILNDSEVRTELANRGILIPSETCFLAAEHDTTRDLVRFIVEDIPADRRDAAAIVARNVDAAAARNRAERVAALPASPLGFGAAPARATDWAQVRPEWGLARNAALIVAPRSLTRDIDLGGRCFLHSYDSAADTGGTALEQILTAPMVVAEWINLHYFFATVDPQRFGSGDKVLQQPVGGFGVLFGNGGDLRLGLPLQSTTIGKKAYHEPLRLQTIVYAPIARIDAVIARQTILQRLFNNHWVTLIAIDPHEGVARRYAGNHTWLPAHSTEVVSCSQTA